jgi:hypothetical protein
MSFIPDLNITTLLSFVHFLIVSQVTTKLGSFNTIDLELG